MKHGKSYRAALELVEKGREYLFGMYIDKSGRPCVTMRIGQMLQKDASFEKGELVDGTVYESHLSVQYNNVKTDTGAVYKNFGYYQTRTDTKEPGLVGINVFSLKLPDSGDYITVGGFSSEYEEELGRK